MSTRARVGLAILVLFVLTALVGPLLIPLDVQPDYDARFLGASLRHPLGTDYAGRDVLGQIVHGSRDILLIAFSTGLIATLIACLVGIGAGLAGGLPDRLLTTGIDIFLTVPSFPIMAILSALLRVDSAWTFGALLALWSWPGLARSLRAQVQSMKKREFIEVAELMRLGWTHILLREIMPNLVPYISLNFILIARNAITASVGIMLLGLVPLRVENWGMMLNLAAFQSGALFLPQGRLYLLAPLVAIVTFQYALILFAGGIEERFDPRLQRQG